MKTITNMKKHDVVKETKNMNRPYYLPFFTSEDEYKHFSCEMASLANENELPIALEYDKDPEGIDTSIIKRFTNRFREDTSLEASFHFYTCENCSRLHCIMTVDEE